MRRMSTVALLILLIAVGAAGQQPWCWNADEIRAEVRTGGVQVFHDGAYYNCCPDPIIYDLIVLDELAILSETALEETPCDCLCCFDLQVFLVGLPSTVHTLRFRWYDLESGSWQWRDVALDLAATDRNEDPHVGDQWRSPCLNQETAVPPPVSVPWGWLKSRYH